MEPRGLTGTRSCKRGKPRLDENPTTKLGHRQQADAGSGERARGARESFSTETKSWGQKAKQEPKFRFYALYEPDLSAGCIGNGMGTGAAQ